jgi:hypothetical protein
MIYECFADKEVPNDWRVEGMDADTCKISIVIFSGHDAADKARQYYFFITRTQDASAKS